MTALPLSRSTPSAQGVRVHLPASLPIIIEGHRVVPTGPTPWPKDTRENREHTGQDSYYLDYMSNKELPNNSYVMMYGKRCNNESTELHEQRLQRLQDMDDRAEARARAAMTGEWTQNLPMAWNTSARVAP
jgi:hypothetical protein